MKRPFAARKHRAGAENPSAARAAVSTEPPPRIFHLRRTRNQRSHPLRTRRQLHNVFRCPHFTTRAPFIPSSWRGTADSLSSAPRPLCLISVIRLMRPGLWQAAGTYTKGGGTEMCPQISVTPRSATPSDSAAKSEASAALAERGWGITRNYLDAWKSAHFFRNNGMWVSGRGGGGDVEWKPSRIRWRVHFHS